MVKELTISLEQADPPALLAPAVPLGTVASGYYVDQQTGLQYYYNAYTDQWYLCQGTLLYALSESWVPSPTPVVNILPGESLRFNLSFTYQGIAQTIDFRAALGTNKTSGSFDEWSDGFVVKGIPLPECLSPTPITDKYIDVEVPAARAGLEAAAYAKVEKMFPGAGEISDYYYDVCKVVSAEITGMSIDSFEKVV